MVLAVQISNDVVFQKARAFGHEVMLHLRLTEHPLPKSAAVVLIVVHAMIGAFDYIFDDRRAFAIISAFLYITFDYALNDVAFAASAWLQTLACKLGCDLSRLVAITTLSEVLPKPPSYGSIPSLSPCTIIVGIALGWCCVALHPGATHCHDARRHAQGGRRHRLQQHGRRPKNRSIPTFSAI